MTYSEFLKLQIGDIVYRKHREYEKQEPYIIIKIKIHKEIYLKGNSYIEYTAAKTIYNPYNEKYFYYKAFITNDTYEIFTKGEKIDNWGFHE